FQFAKEIQFRAGGSKPIKRVLINTRIEWIGACSRPKRVAARISGIEMGLQHEFVGGASLDGSNDDVGLINPIERFLLNFDIQPGLPTDLRRKSRQLQRPIRRSRIDLDEFSA